MQRTAANAGDIGVALRCLAAILGLELPRASGTTCRSRPDAELLGDAVAGPGVYLYRPQRAPGPARLIR